MPLAQWSRPLHVVEPLPGLETASSILVVTGGDFGIVHVCRNAGSNARLRRHCWPIIRYDDVRVDAFWIECFLVRKRHLWEGITDEVTVGHGVCHRGAGV